jgi:hypothetical protein
MGIIPELIHFQFEEFMGILEELGYLGTPMEFALVISPDII